MSNGSRPPRFGKIRPIPVYGNTIRLPADFDDETRIANFKAMGYTVVFEGQTECEKLATEVAKKVLIDVSPPEKDPDHYPYDQTK